LFTEQPITAAEQPACWLFLLSPDRRRPRISAANEKSVAVNLPPKQQTAAAWCGSTPAAWLLEA
jgi:hypothetical protein